MMRRSYPLAGLCLAVLLFSHQVLAQDFEIPPVGSDATFNVATWNIEHFGVEGEGPSNTQLQFDIVLSVMQQANVHLWALQEMNDQATFFNLVDALGENWAGVWQPDQTSFSIGYGYIYRSDIVEPTLVTTILTNHAFEFAFRPPLLMRANLTLPGGTVSGIRFINLHAKCCGGFTDWERRRDASIALKSYVDQLLAANFKVIVLGDLNDRLRTSISSGRPSPYGNFRTDEDRYHFGTLSLEDAGVNTYCANASCTSGSTIDHILITAPVFDDYEWDSTARYDALLSNIPNYRNTTSDHVAVYSRFDFFKPSSEEPGADPQRLAVQAPFPNPVHDVTTISFSLPVSANVQIEVFDTLGRRVHSIANGYLASGMHQSELSADGLAPGLYLVRVTTLEGSHAQSATRRMLVVR